jgi:hypothetical protein
MTRNEAKEIMQRHNAWRRGKRSEANNPVLIGIAIDRLTQPNQIAQSIRNSAINWPLFICDEYFKIIDAFAGYGFYDVPEYWEDYLRGYKGQNAQFKARTFLLIVAEALED